MKLFELILYLSDPKLYVKFGWGGGLKRKLSTVIFYAHLYRLYTYRWVYNGEQFYRTLPVSE